MNGSFQRKVTYLVLIAALLAPLAMISRPATGVVGEDQGGAGGKLAQLRGEYKLGQAQLGRIDPTSSAMRYLSLGLHGVAVCILDQKAAEYQRQENWIGLKAVLNQKLALQPYYVNVWVHQAWNVAYNIASQWDDYRDKFYWVVRGVKYLPEGMAYNKREPKFPYELGWMVGHKIGQADERREYRRLFAGDDELHREPWAEWVDRRDSWLFGKRYLELAQDMVDHQGAVLKTMGAENFNVQTPISQGRYAEAIEREGTFGDKARAAWRQTHVDWTAYGDREFPSEYGFFYRLNDLKSKSEALQRALDGLTALVPGARELLLAEKRAALSAEMRSALDTPPSARSVKEDRLANDAAYRTFVSDAEVAERAPEPQREAARRAAAEVVRLKQEVNAIKQGRDIAVYEYWLARTEAESTDEALAARQAFFEAEARADDDPWEARKKFELGFAEWRVLLDKYPTMVDDQTSFDINEYVLIYRRVLKLLDEPFDRSTFILRDVLEKYPDRM